MTTHTRTHRHFSKIGARRRNGFHGSGLPGIQGKRPGTLRGVGKASVLHLYHLQTLPGVHVGWAQGSLLPPPAWEACSRFAEMQISFR